MSWRWSAILALGGIVATYLVGCGSTGISSVPPEVEAPPLRVPGVLIEISSNDLAPGFGPTPNNLVNDIPGFLREHENEILRAIGERARDPNVRSLGFQNTREDKFLFVVQVALQEEQAARDTGSAHARQECTLLPTLRRDRRRRRTQPGRGRRRGNLRQRRQRSPHPGLSTTECQIADASA